MGCGGVDGVDGVDGVEGTVGTREHCCGSPLGAWWRRVASNGHEWQRMLASMGGWGVDTEGGPSVSPVVRGHAQL